MPAPSLGQKLANRPSRSYLAGLNEAGGGGNDTGSVLSFRSGGSNYSTSGTRRQRGIAESLAGGSPTSPGYNNADGSPTSASSPRGRYNSMPTSASAMKAPRGSAASDIGGGMSYGPVSRLRTLSSVLGVGGASSSYRGKEDPHRRSVTFGDLNPALFDDRDKLEVMSDMGNYGRFRKKQQAPSMASSVASFDNGSDAGSTFSATRRTRRGSRTDKVTRTSPSMDLWHNNLGGPGMAKLSNTGGTVVSTANPLSSIVQRTSSLSSPKKLLEREPQPSRRYTLQPDPALATGSASGSQAGGKKQKESNSATQPGDTLQLPSSTKSKDGRSSPTSSNNSSPANSEASFGLKTTVHSRHTQKQRQKSGLPDSSGKVAIPQPGDAGLKAPGLKRSASAGSSASKKSNRSTVSSSAKGATTTTSSSQGLGQPLALHSTVLKNNLVNMPKPHTSPTKKKRTPEQVVEALAKAGLLDRVMEAVQEADEEESAVSGNESTNRAQAAGTTAVASQSADQVHAPAPVKQQEQQQQQTSQQNGHVLRPHSQYFPAVTHQHQAQPSISSIAESTSNREELNQTPALEFVTPPSTPPLSPSEPVTALPEQESVGAPVTVLTNGHASSDHQPGDVTPTAPPALSTPATSGTPVEAGPQKQADVLVYAGTIPVPAAGSPALRLESLTAVSTYNPHLVSRQLQGTLLAQSAFAQSALFVRLTWNQWANYEEVIATLPAASAPTEDFRRYQWTWHMPPGTNAAEVQFALRLEDADTHQAHWDNNGGDNYTAKLGDIVRRDPAPSKPASVNSEAPVPPRVFLVRTGSDNSNEPNVIYEPPAPIIAQTERSPHISGIPFPKTSPEHRGAPFTALSSAGPNTDSTVSLATGSSTSIATPSVSARDGEIRGAGISHAGLNNHMNGYSPSAVPKHVTADGLAHDKGSLNSSRTPSRAHSTASHATEDSTNAPFHYPSSRIGAYQAAALQHQPSHRQRPSSEAQQMDMPNIMTALDTRSKPDDLSGLYTVNRASSFNGNNNANGSRFGHSDAGSVGARSQGGMSNMSVPSATRLNTKAEVKPFSMSSLTTGEVILPTTNSTMQALTLTSNATQTLGKSFWKNNEKKSLRQQPNKLPDHLNGKIGTTATVTFSNLTPVPQKIRSDECLVQVFCSAIDFWDMARLEILHNRGQGYGFVPGRAFVGRVLEAGKDVVTNKVKKGDFVYGLTDLRKSGALAEYISVQRGVLTQAPNGVLSLEQIAAVALSGIAAYQAMDELCNTLARGSKLVIMNAHEGVGAIALQLGQSLRPAGDLWMVAHYPSDFSDGDSILRQLGAAETLCGEPIAALQSLQESAYDAVLDTIGGRKTYDASKRILHNDGYFVTTVGDALSVPTKKASWRTSFKALFKNRDKKHVLYWFPSIDSDATAALDRLRGISESGQLKPVVKRVYKFEDGAKAFQGPTEQAVIMLLDQEKLANKTA